MRVICKPDVKQQLDALIDNAIREGNEIDYIELAREEFNEVWQAYYFEIRIGRSKHGYIYVYRGYEIKVI